MEYLEYLVSRIEVLETRDMQFRENLNKMRRKQERQVREIASLRRSLGGRQRQHTETYADIVNDNEKQLVTESDVPETHTADRTKTVSDDRKQGIRSAEVDINVAFFATLSVELPHLGKNQIIAFDNVVVNEGNAYNPHVGVFVAPVSGTYVFSTTVTGKERSVTNYAFTYNGRILTTIYVNGVEKWYDSSSQTIVLQLNQGDDVSVEHTESDTTIAGTNHSIFSGFLLRQTSATSNSVG